MSEWEQFKAYQGIIVDAKREERERIIKLLDENHLTAASELIWEDMHERADLRHAEAKELEVIPEKPDSSN